MLCNLKLLFACAFFWLATHLRTQKCLSCEHRILTQLCTQTCLTCAHRPLGAEALLENTYQNLAHLCAQALGLTITLQPWGAGWG